MTENEDNPSWERTVPRHLEGGSTFLSWMATDRVWVWRMKKWISWKAMGPQRKPPNLGGVRESEGTFKRTSKDRWRDQT